MHLVFEPERLVLPAQGAALGFQGPRPTSTLKGSFVVAIPQPVEQNQGCAPSPPEYKRARGERYSPAGDKVSTTPTEDVPTPRGFLARLRRWWRGLWVPRTIRELLAAFFGPDYARLETHDKTYPGYDLASLHLALTSFLAHCTTEPRAIGSCGSIHTMRELFDATRSFFTRNLMPAALTFERVPTDVEEEGSFITNILHVAILRPHAGLHRKRKQASAAPLDEMPAPALPEKIAILLAVRGTGSHYHEGFESATGPTQQIWISIACRSRDVANRFFAEIEERRQRLSIYRGKVIDPVVAPGSIQTIGFRAIRPVTADQLVLTDEVRNLLHRSVLSFYQHRDTLQELGIDLKRGLLFHGPPGTGKTSISLYLAGHLPHFTICFVSGERLLYPREICRMARYLQPTMLVFEDIDLVAQERNSNGLATVLGELMNQIDGCEPTDQVLFILNTNSLERLEHAVKNRPGRVDQIIALPMPDRSQRELLLRTFARNLKLAADDLSRVLEATEGTTPAMLKEIIKRAAVAALEQLGQNKVNGPLLLHEKDLLLAAEQVRALRDPEAAPGTFGFRERGG
jgi:ATPase family associated with various cellular activities (AAA)